MSQRIADASAKVARSSYPPPRRRTTSLRPLWDNWPSFPERSFSTQTLRIVSVLLGFFNGFVPGARFTRNGKSATVRPSGPLRVNNGDAMMPALIAGTGLGILP
jgi:hypothetical protein